MRCLISIGLIAIVLRKINWDTLGSVLFRGDLPLVVLGSALTFFLIASLAVRWQIFLRQQQVKLPLQAVVGLTWAGQFFNSFLPGSTGGDIVKIYQLCRLIPNRKPSVAATVIADRLTALVALLTLAAVSFAIEPAPLRLLSGITFPLQLVVVVFLVGALGAVIFFRGFRATHWPARIGRLLLACREALAPSWSLAGAVALAFAVHLLNFFIIYLFARALHLTISYRQVLLVMPVVLFLVLLPVTINGHGLRELLLIAYFTYMGISLNGEMASGPQETAVALSLLVVANDLLWSIPGGIWYFAKFRGAASNPPASEA